MGSIADARRSSKGKDKATYCRDVNEEEDEEFDMSMMEAIDGQRLSFERTMHETAPRLMWSTTMSVRTRMVLKDPGPSKSVFEESPLLEGWEEMESGYVRSRERCEVTGMWKTVRGVRRWERRDVGERVEVEVEEARGREDARGNGKDGEEELQRRNSDVSPLDLGRGEAKVSE